MSSATQLLLGLAGLVLTTWIFFRFQLGLTAAALACLIVIVLLSLTGRVVPVMLSFVALVLLNYFFTEPVHQRRTEEPVALAVFILTSLIVSRLVRKAKRTEEKIRDQTALLQRAHDALRESEEQWRAGFENNPTMYFMVDASGTILSVNPFGAEQLGYQVGELVGSAVLDVFHPADRGSVQQNVGRCLENRGQSMNWQLRKVRKDGRVIWVRETARAVLMKGRPVVLVACEDITEAKRLEEELKSAEQRLSAVIANAPLILFAVDHDGIIVLAEGHGLERLRAADVTRADVIGRSVLELTHDEPHLLADMRRALLGESFTHVREAWGVLFETHVAPLRDAEGRPAGFNAITIDITERRRAEDALTKVQMQLAHVSRVSTMSEVTGSLAHELNQPLAAIVNNANACLGLLPEGPELDGVRHALADIVTDGTRAIIERVRGLVKRSSGEKVPLRLADVVNDVAALVAAESVTRNAGHPHRRGAGPARGAGRPRPIPAGPPEPRRERHGRDERGGGGKSPAGDPRAP